ncbi:4-alpha-glucanotransferase [Georgenia sp. Z1344]|uniref:4-alpha-glucanotransferase n=1 Tax=Georgenia sp. Z1344 TaxID=3416706 RepID=UPI003CF0482E
MDADDAVAPSQALARLADLKGVATEFWDFHGKHRTISAATIRSALRALGVPADTDDEVAESLEEHELAPWREVLPDSVVVRQGHESRLSVYVPLGTDVHVEVRLEDGERWELSPAAEPPEMREVDGRTQSRVEFVVPADLPLGWHTVVAKPAGARRRRAPMAVTPDRLQLPELEGGRGWGLSAQLYSVRSRRSWGLGDAADLAELAALAGGSGADFILINPLHAAQPVQGMETSPYLPVTRRFVNPIYLRPEEIHEATYLSGPERSLVQWAADEVRPLNETNEPLDRDAVWAAKLQALEVIFAAGRSAARQQAFERFRADEGEGLEDFALWCALLEDQAGEPWPVELTDPASPQVALKRSELADRVEFFAWLQWVLDEQLAAAQRAATESGMRLGIMHDLAVGVDSQGAERWSGQEVFAAGIEVGAPPDMYNQQGQNWSQPPWRPDALARTAYAPLRQMLRTVLRHAGAIRVDHVAGLFRLWWIPTDGGADQGTYVSYDHEAMVGVLLLEAHRAGAVVIGEDLGTVEPWVRDYLEERGVLGTQVFWFEKDEDGRPKEPADYRRLALATVDTHDLPPVAGYLADEHVDLRERLGLLVEPVEQVRAESALERRRTVERLREHGLVGEDPSEREILEALHAYVAATPSYLVGVSLVDAVGERRAQNQPGTHTEYPNWKVPLADGTEQVVLLDDLHAHPRVRSLVATVERAMGRQGR